MTPQALAIILLAGFALLVAPRRWTMPILVLVSVFISMRQRLDFGGLDFMPHRLLLLFAWTRILLRGEHRGFVPHRIDKWLLAFTVWTAIAYVILRDGDPGAMINRAGDLFNTTGLYFFFRFNIREPEDFRHAVNSLLASCVVMAGCMLTEYIVRWNPLSVLGYVSDTVQTRLGRVRCQAAFGHPISAGVWGATLLPLWIACWRMDDRLKKYTILGIATAIVITGASGSSSPVGAFLAGILGLFFWKVRRQLGLIRWVVVLTLTALHFVMKAPVWALIARIDITAGNSGYHRFKLVDNAIRNADEWWAVGTLSTDHWGFNMVDLANQFVANATKGGLLGLLLFVLLLAACFREVGRLARELEFDGDQPAAFFVWSFGAMLFAHCATFMGYSYWDQVIVLWYFLLAMVASLRVFLRTEVPAYVSDPAAEPPFSAARSVAGMP